MCCTMPVLPTALGSLEKSTVVSPSVIVAAAAVSAAELDDATFAPAWVTAMVCDAVAEPLTPEHEMVNVVCWVNAFEDWVPDVANVSDHPPDAVHEVALVEDHFSETDWPAETLD
jgi:hypothetical protein